MNHHQAVASGNHPLERPIPEENATNRYLRRLLITLGVVAVAGAVLFALFSAAEVFLLVFAGILLAVAFRGIAGLISRLTSLSGGVSLGLTFLGLTLLFGLGMWFLAATLAGQFEQLTSSLAESATQLQERLSQYGWGQKLLEQMPEPGELLRGRTSVLSQISSIFSTSLGTIANVVIVLFVGVYLAVDPDTYRHGLLRLVPVARRGRADDVLQSLRTTLERWLVGRFIDMVVVGLTTGIGLWLLGMPAVLALALIAALFVFVPYLGPIVAALPAMLVALAISPMMSLYVGLLYLGIQSLESYLLEPLIQQRSVHIPPAVTVSAQVLLGILLGTWGILLATPLTAVVLVLVRTLYVEDYLEQAEQATRQTVADASAAR